MCSSSFNLCLLKLFRWMTLQTACLFVMFGTKHPVCACVFLFQWFQPWFLFFIHTLIWLAVYPHSTPFSILPNHNIYAHYVAQTHTGSMFVSTSFEPYYIECLDYVLEVFLTIQASTVLPLFLLLGSIDSASVCLLHFRISPSVYCSCIWVLFALIFWSTSSALLTY